MTRSASSRLARGLHFSASGGGVARRMTPDIETPLMRMTFLVVFALLLRAADAVVAQDRAADEAFFETKIRPVLITKCFKCHGGEKVSSDFRVDSRDALLKGGDSGTALVVGKPDESPIVRAMSYVDNDLKMPPDKQLPANVVDDFRRWIQSGAVWPKSAEPRDPAFKTQRHWAFRPVEKPIVPDSTKPGWSRNAIDAFVLQKLDAAKLAPSAQADRATLIRRLKFDLLGLPPSYQEVTDFVSDARPNAFEVLVAKYLESPHYGERWGRYWLDIARFADTKGYVFQEDRNYPAAPAYRDWVIRSLNEDLPYDQFLIRQIAADRLVKDSGLPPSELAAMGFLTLGRRFLNNIHDIIDDRLDVTIRGTMGITIGCARCHDHKFDPIPAADYYSLYGVFASSHEPKDVPNAMPLYDNEKPTQPYIFLRGQAGNHGPQVPRQFLELVAGKERKPFANGSGRLELAQAIASPDNPLTARVIVNRVWREHFHAALVNSASDFGLRCDPPTHPELLDYLAATLVENRWSLKSLHQLIVNSASYQQRSDDDSAKRAVDSTNRLLWRMNRGRLNLEGMRDAVLATSGSIDPTVGGKSVDITKADSPRRRTIYGFIDRQNLPAFFRTFDFAGPDAHNPGRFETTVPQQTLFLRNSPFMATEMRLLASRLPASSDEQRIIDLYHRVLGREPEADELTLAREFVGDATIEQPTSTNLWSYGYGRFDVETGKLAGFKPLPHFTGLAWQGGSVLPDPTIGWVHWSPNGGHPGNRDHSAVLRWTAPRTLKLRAAGQLRHAAKEGDGVQGFVVINGLRIVSKWSVKATSKPTAIGELSVEAGDTIDFVVHCGADENSDSFGWAPRLEEVGESSLQWDAGKQFRGAAPSALDVWSQLTQVLLLSNEFQFVD